MMIAVIACHCSNRETRNRRSRRCQPSRRLRCVSAERIEGVTVCGGNFCRTGYGEMKIAEQTVTDPINPRMNGQLLAAIPSFANDGGVADIDRLLDGVQVAQAVGAQAPIGDRIEKRGVLMSDILDV